jgi:hypothetical protein
LGWLGVLARLVGVQDDSKIYRRMDDDFNLVAVRVNLV